MTAVSLRRLLGQVPLALLLAGPSSVGLVVVVLRPETALIATCAAALVCLLLGAVVAGELRAVGRRTPVVSRELADLHARVIREAGHPEVIRRVVGASRESVSSATHNTSRLLAELVRAEEETRASLAGELHDTVAQTLAQALLQLDPARPDGVGSGIEAVREAEDQLRAVLARIRPPQLAEGDLAAAVADLCAEMRARYAVDVEVSWPDVSLPLSGTLATTSYRFVQETLLNAVQHADGVGVRLEVGVVDGDQLEFAVSDRGPGFCPDSVDSSLGRHVGLRIARERARLAGGRVEVVSQPGQGTTVRLRVPLALRVDRALRSA